MKSLKEYIKESLENYNEFPTREEQLQEQIEYGIWDALNIAVTEIDGESEFPVGGKYPVKAINPVGVMNPVEEINIDDPRVVYLTCKVKNVSDDTFRISVSLHGNEIACGIMCGSHEGLVLTAIQALKSLKKLSPEIFI